MHSRFSGPAVHTALDFLIARLRTQAQRDDIPLSEVEIQQLFFSEEVATPKEITAAAEFDASENRAAFERKITQLLRHAYQADEQNGTHSLWHEHLSALRNIDVYILVMIDRARIPRPQPEAAELQLSWKGFATHGQAYAIALFLIVLAGVLGFFILHH